MIIRIAPMRWWHIAELAHLEEELFGAERWTPAMFWSELAQPDTRYYRIALTDTEDAPSIVGYAGLCVYEESPYAHTSTAWIQTIGVTQWAQHRGIGSALVEDLLAHARSRNAETVNLEVRVDNDSAQRLYARYGFEPVAIRRNYYQPSGTDAVTMTLELVS